MRYPTDEEQVQRADNAWHDFRRVELTGDDPEREAMMKDELVNYIPDLIEVAQRLRARELALMELARAVANSGNAEDFRQRAAYLLNYHIYASDAMRQQAHALLASEPQP